MAPPAALVRTARSLWQAEWRLLMGGLGPADAQGRYRRPAAAFGVTPALPDDAAVAGGHVLIVGRSCPWAHRAWLCHSLRQLGGSISVEVVDPDPAAGRWRFSRPFEGCDTLMELYRASGADPGRPATVPALYSRSRRRIVVNESARLIELLDAWPSPAAALWPEEQRPRIELWRERFQGTVNDGVYRCGFARNQQAYDEAEQELFATLEAAEEQLLAMEAAGGAGACSTAAGPEPETAGGIRAAREPAGWQAMQGGTEANRPGAAAAWLCGGPDPTLADVVLFPTLIRLELVYAPLFGCSRLPLRQLPALHRWRARFYGLPGVAATCFPEAWRRDYFGALFPLHPSGIIPAGPDLATLVAA